jgi:phenylalanyl-tRNA synthetase beta chain
MKIPLSWLKKYIDIQQAPSEIAHTLTMLGLEVESVDSFSPSFDNVVIGEVTGCSKHPNADNLQVASVTDGEVLVQVVCGAPNCRKGLKTAFCRVGGTIEEESGKVFKVKKAKIRGVESFGMLCSEKELRLSEDHEKIIELPEDAETGADLKKLYEEDVLEVALTPNLGYTASLLGVARELSAALRIPYKRPDAKIVEESDTIAAEKVSVEIHDDEKCPRYACRLVENAAVGPSPLWLQQALGKVGIRSVNNIVDVTNYVLMEMGHPLHAFDFDKVDGGEIHVRAAKEGEVIKTLDEKNRTLQEGFLLICDKSQPIALAGVMGGFDSEVSGATVNVLIESAAFEPGIIRKASKHYGLISEASKRFERGCDPNNVLPALDRAAALMREVSGGKIAKGFIDEKKRDFKPQIISCRVGRTNDILGTRLSSGEVEDVFDRLGFSAEWKDSDTLEVEVPTYRVDVSGEIDLIEEVARIYGYDNIPKSAGRYVGSDTPHAPIFLFERKTRERLIAEGLQEILTCDLISPEQVKLVQEGAITEDLIIRVKNPSSLDQSVLRPSLMPGMLQVVKYNQDRQMLHLSAFEIGRVHFHKEDQFREQSAAGILLTGAAQPYYYKEKPRDVDFYDLKGIFENVMRALSVSGLEFVKSDLNAFHPGRQASAKVGDMTIATLGEIHPRVTREVGIAQKVYYAEFNLHDLLQVRAERKKMHEIPLYPSSSRDWTITMIEEEPVDSIFKAISSLGSNLLEDTFLLDIYRSERIGKGRKNVTIRLVYRSQDKTVSQQDVDQEHSRLTEETLKLLGKSVI